MDKEFWNNKVVLITGHTGFKGSWLSLWLQNLGAKVAGYSLPPPTEPNLFTLASVEQGMESVMGDIRDYNGVFNFLTQIKPEIIFHMAAQPLVAYSYEAPVETYATNVMGTVHLLEAARQIKSVKAIVNITSDKCYENKEWHWGYRENDPLGGYDPYSNSKACSEFVTNAYRNSYFNPNQYEKHGVAIASARAGNVIGGGDWANDRLIPDIIKNCLIGGNKVLIRRPMSVRPWQFVLEPLSGYLVLAQKLYEDGVMFSEAWNFGPTDEDAKPVSWVADHVVKFLDNGSTWVYDKNSEYHETNYLKLDCSKARSLLGWKSRWDLERGLKETVEWYKTQRYMNNMHEFSLTQIEAYTHNRVLLENIY